MKSNLFSQSQRDTAKKLLDRLEGDRRRKCRTSNNGIDANIVEDTLFAPSIRKELLIVSSKKKRKKGIKPQNSKAVNDEDDESDTDDENKQTKKKTNRESELDDDGFLKHSDDEGDWSDVDDGTVSTYSPPR